MLFLQGPKNEWWRVMQVIDRYFRLKVVFWTLAILLGGLQAFSRWSFLSGPDIVSYLDIADAYSSADFSVGVNAYWSPLYSWLLGFAMAMVHPSPYWEFAVVKATNFVIFVGTIGCFEFFLRSFLSYGSRQRQDTSLLVISDRVWIVVGYTLFIWASIKWNGVHVDTPDLCTSAFVYLVAGCLLRIQLSNARTLYFLLLGGTLGAGYLAKAVLLPLSFVFLIVSAIAVRKQPGSGRGILLAVCAFLVVSLPFCIGLSVSKGRLTFGDSGKLNYAWFVSPGYPAPTNWQGEEALHPTRKISSNPEAFEFAAPIAGTYPPWYDPTYWWEGLSMDFSPAKQMNVVAKNTHFYFRCFLGALLLGYSFLIIAGKGLRCSLQALPDQWQLLIPALAGLGAFLVGTDMYAIHIDVQPGTRYISPFIVLLYMSFLSSIRLTRPESRKLIAYVIAAYLAVGWLFLSFQAVRDIRRLTGVTHHPHWQVAEGLKKLGVEIGGEVAILGDEDAHVYWARLARVRIVAQIPDIKEYQSLSRGEKRSALESLKASGAMAVITKSEEEDPTGIWKRAGDTDYAVCILRSLPSE